MLTITVTYRVNYVHLPQLIFSTGYAIIIVLTHLTSNLNCLMPSFMRPYESVAVRDCSKTVVGHLVTRIMQKDGHYPSSRVDVLLLSIALLFYLLRTCIGKGILQTVHTR